MTGTAVAPPTAAKSALPRRTRLADPAVGVWLAAGAVTAAGWIVVAARGGDFLTLANVVGILQNCVALGLVAVGQTAVILTGSLDLSVAYLISLGTLVAATTMEGGSVVTAVLAVLTLSAAVGLANGLVVTGLKVNAFIATLGTAFILRGWIEDNYTGPMRQGPRVLPAPRLRPDGACPRLPVPARRGRRRPVVRHPSHTLRTPPVRDRGRRARGPPLRCPHPAHRRRRARPVLAVRGSRRALPRRAARRGRPLGRHGGPLRPRVDRRRRPRRHRTRGRARGVAGTLGGVLVLAVLDSVFNQLGVDPFFKNVVRGVVIIAAVALYARRGTGRPA